MLPNRIVLSRKGCDEKYGRCPSFIIETEMVSIPIPELHFLGSVSYSDLKLPRSLRGNGRNSFGDLINSIPVKRRGALQASAKVHLDPDIRKDIRHDPQPTNWKPRLGQCCRPDAALQSLTTGDLFIFFGWYVQAQWVSEVEFSSKKGFHAIWGWLQLGRPPIKVSHEMGKGLGDFDHPHFAPLRDGCKHDGNRNSVYEASENLSFRTNTPGAGVFRFTPLLRLTHPACRSGCRSLWRLPRFFHERLTPFPREAWCKEGQFTYVQAAGQNQEYVFERPADGGLDHEIQARSHRERTFHCRL